LLKHSQELSSPFSIGVQASTSFSSTWDHSDHLEQGELCDHGKQQATELERSHLLKPPAATGAACTEERWSRHRGYQSQLAGAACTTDCTEDRWTWHRSHKTQLGDAGAARDDAATAHNGQSIGSSATEFASATTSISSCATAAATATRATTATAAPSTGPNAASATEDATGGACLCGSWRRGPRYFRYFIAHFPCPRKGPGQKKVGFGVKSRLAEGKPPHVIVVRPEGAMAEYNARCAQASFHDDVVCVGDEILEVNGVVWESGEDPLMKKLGEDEMLFIVLRRQRCSMP